MFIKNYGMVITIEISGINTTGTYKNRFRLVLVLGYGARVLPLELVPEPGHGAQINARATTKGYVQTGAHARKSEEGLSVF